MARLTVFKLGNRRGDNGLPGPMVAFPLLKIEGARVRGRMNASVRRPWSASANPFFQQGNFFCRQLLLRRHLIGVAIADCVDHQALVRLMRHDRRATVASFENRRTRIEPQARLLFLRTMATLAACDQKRTNLAFEEFERLGDRTLVLSCQ